MKKHQRFLKLKLLCCVWMLGMTGSYAIASSQPVSVQFKNVTLHELIWELEKQTTFNFVYNTGEVKAVQVKELNVDETDALEVLRLACLGSGLTFEVYDEVVVIKPQPVVITAPQAPQQQGITVRGRVVDAAGEPVVGAYISIEGTNLGTAAGIDGQFVITAPADGRLVFSIIGYRTLTVNITGRTTIDVVMEEDALALEQIIVVAYGEQKKSAFTGSASVLTAEAIAARPVTNVMSALEGIVSGVQMQSTSGAPDSSPSFRIRGVSSISAGRDPLVVVDGVPFESGWNNINPNDVESVTVLKDAASIAIYGARGGNGVILITTKKAGRMENNVVVSFDAKFASSRVRLSDLYDVISEPGEYYERHYLAMYNYYLDAEKRDPFDANQKANEVWMKGTDVGGLGYLVYSVPDGQMLIGRNGKLNPYATLGRMVTGIDGNTYWQVPDDWVRETYSPGFRQDYNINVRGGTNKMSVLASAGYSKEMGVTDKADYSRFTGRLKATFDAKSWLKINASLDIAVSDTNNDTDYNYNSNNIFSNATRYAPIYPIFIRGEDKNILYNEHGKVYDYGEGSYNEGVHRPFHPGSSRLQEALLQTRHTASVRTGAQIGADVKLTRDLTVTLNASYDERDRRYKTTAQPFYGSSNPGGYVTINHYKNEALNLQQLVNYVKSFGDHNVRATLLHEWYKRDLYSLYGFKTGMYSYFENQEFGGAITVNNTTSYHRPYNSEGFGGRVMYDYRNIYYFDASFRRDASSIFHPNHRWGNFFSFGAGYMLSREKFFDVPWVDELKLKVSMGQNGNDQIGGSYNRYEDAYSVENVGGQIALMFAYPGNPNITWETRTAINTGIEFQLFKGRLSGGVDYYNNITSDMLSAVSVPYSLGYSSYWANVGSMRNQGIEIELRGDIIRTKDFHWSMYVNAAMNRNKILDLADERKGETLYDINGNPLAKGYSSSAGGYFMGEGREYRTWYLRKFAGVNEKGAPLWWTADELLADKADPDDADVVIGLTNIRTTDIYSSATFFDTGKSSQPKVLGGFGGSVGWKSLQLSFAFAYRLGGYAMDEGYRTLMGTPYVGRTGYNNHKDTRNAWTPEKPNNDIPIWQFGEQYFTAASDRWLTKADFLSLQNVSLAYAVPKSFAKKIGIEGITASIGMDNLFILTHRKGFIPTRDFDGSLDYGYYPEMTRYMLNLSFKF